MYITFVYNVCAYVIANRASYGLEIFLLLERADLQAHFFENLFVLFDPRETVHRNAWCFLRDCARRHLIKSICAIKSFQSTIHPLSDLWYCLNAKMAASN